MLGLCETVRCRRQYLLEYFGEASEPCGNCDNCLSPPAQFDGTEAAQKLLSCIYRCERASGFGFGAQQIIDVLRGERTAKVLQRGHDSVSTFGIGADMSEAQWRAVLRQLVTLRLVAVDHDHYNVLRLTEASREVLKGDAAADAAAGCGDPRRAARRSRKARKGCKGAARPSSRRLRRSRKPCSRRCANGGAAIAKEHGVPAYTVLHDSSLREIAQRLPDTTALTGRSEWRRRHEAGALWGGDHRRGAGGTAAGRLSPHGH